MLSAGKTMASAGEKKQASTMAQRMALIRGAINPITSSSSSSSFETNNAPQISLSVSPGVIFDNCVITGIAKATSKNSKAPTGDIHEVTIVEMSSTSVKITKSDHPVGHYDEAGKCVVLYLVNAVKTGEREYSRTIDPKNTKILKVGSSFKYQPYADNLRRPDNNRYTIGDAVSVFGVSFENKVAQNQDLGSGFCSVTAKGMIFNPNAPKKSIENLLIEMPRTDTKFGHVRADSPISDADFEALSKRDFKNDQKAYDRAKFEKQLSEEEKLMISTHILHSYGTTDIEIGEFLKDRNSEWHNVHEASKIFPVENRVQWEGKDKAGIMFPKLVQSTKITRVNFADPSAPKKSVIITSRTYSANQLNSFGVAELSHASLVARIVSAGKYSCKIFVGLPETLSLIENLDPNVEIPHLAAFISQIVPDNLIQNILKIGEEVNADYAREFMRRTIGTDEGKKYSAQNPEGPHKRNPLNENSEAPILNVTEMRVNLKSLASSGNYRFFFVTSAFVNEMTKQSLAKMTVDERSAQLSPNKGQCYPGGEMAVFAILNDAIEESNAKVALETQTLKKFEEESKTESYFDPNEFKESEEDANEINQLMSSIVEPKTNASLFEKQAQKEEEEEEEEAEVLTQEEAYEICKSDVSEAEDITEGEDVTEGEESDSGTRRPRTAPKLRKTKRTRESITVSPLKKPDTKRSLAFTSSSKKSRS